MKLVREHISFERPKSEENFKRSIIKRSYYSGIANDLLDRCKEECKELLLKLDIVAEKEGYDNFDGYNKDVWNEWGEYDENAVNKKIENIQKKLYIKIEKIVSEYTDNNDSLEAIIFQIIECLTTGCAHGSAVETIDSYLRK